MSRVVPITSKPQQETEVPVVDSCSKAGNLISRRIAKQLGVDLAVSDTYQGDVAAKFLSWVKSTSVRSVGDERGRSFIPFSALRDYFTREKTADLFGKLALPQSDAPKVRQSALTIFAILVYIGKGDAIERLIHAGLSDADLPFHEDPDEWPGPCSSDSTQVGSDLLQQSVMPPSPSLRAKDLLSDSSTWKDFYREQWQFCPPTFQLDQHHVFESPSILPFISKTELHDLKGGNSAVYRVKIHPEYHRLSRPNDDSCFVAVKSFASTDEENQYRRELDNLKALKDHPGLVQQLATFRHGETYNIIFPYGDTLHDWMQNTRAPDNLNGQLRFWSSLLEVIKPLQRLHETPPHTGYDVNSGEFM